MDKLRMDYLNYKNYTLLKNIRNLILGETDKYLLPDFPITPEQLEIVKIYRQQLRDLTNNDYIMPDKPDFVITLNQNSFIIYKEWRT